MQMVGSKQLPMKFFSSLLITFSLTLSFNVLGSDGQSSLTDQPGRAPVGKSVFNDRDKGHCLLCHQLSTNKAPFQGTIGPALDGVGNRLTDEQLRFRIVDQSRLNPETVMPAYYKTTGLSQVASEFKGKTVLTAQEIEDLVVYLAEATRDEALDDKMSNRTKGSEDD